VIGTEDVAKTNDIILFQINYEARSYGYLALQPTEDEAGNEVLLRD